LLDRAKANDRAAWDRIVQLYAPLVYGWCRRFGLQHADLLEVCQEVLRSVFTKLPEFRRDRPRDSFRQWLKTITRFRALDARAQLRKQPALFSELTPESNPEAPEDCETADEEVSERKYVLRRALEIVQKEIEPRTWDAFWRVVVDERSPAQVAEELAVSVNVVYLARSRVLRRLADQFGEVIDGWQDD
jgi:RNA polymerase sigma-70 factor (ECF subfamily)